MEGASRPGAAGSDHQLAFGGKGNISGIQGCGCSDRGSSHRPGRARVFHQPEFSEFTMVDGMAVALFNRFTTSNNKE